MESFCVVSSSSGWFQKPLGLVIRVKSLACMAYLTGGGSGQPMQIAARRAGKTLFISPELDPIPQVFANTTITRSSSG